MRQIKIITTLFLIISLLACKSNQSATTSKVNSKAPSWVNLKPVSVNDYIGVGGVSKELNYDYKDKAKAAALDNMAKDINERLTSNASKEIPGNKTINPNSYQPILINSKELEGYELKEQWEDRKNYWVYYQISEKKVAEILISKKEKAKETALNEIDLAKEAENKRDAKAAFDHYIDAYISIANYGQAALEVTKNGEIIFLDQYIGVNFQQLLSDIKLIDKTKSKVFSTAKGVKSEIIFEAKYKNATAINLPFVLKYYDNNMRQEVKLKTDAQGMMNYLLMAGQLNIAEFNGEISLNLSELIKFKKNQEYLQQQVFQFVRPSARIKIPLTNK